MKINKYFLGLATLIITGFSSCNTDVEGPTYSTSLQSVSFDAAEQSLIATVDQSEISTSIRITRGVTVGEAVVNVMTEASEEGIFTDDANGTVKFADGQRDAIINVKASNLEKEMSYTYKISLPDAKNTLDTIAKPTQNLVYTIKVTREGDWTEWQKWNKEGTADYYYSGQLFSGEDPDLPFTYRQSLTNSNKYQFRLQKWGYGVDLIINYDDETGVATIPATYTGYTHSTYGQEFIADYGTYKGNNTHGTFDKKLGIFTIPVCYFDADGAWGATYEYVYIDGYVRADYSITSLTYAGIYTDASDNVFAVGNLVLAADAFNVKAVVVDADADADAVADAIAAGELPATDVAAGMFNVPIEQGMIGALQIVAVSFDAEGKVASTAFAKFEYYGGGKNPWQSLGTGYLTDNFFITNFYKDQATQEIWTPQTYEVEILENQETPGLYRIVNAFEGALKLLAPSAWESIYEPSNMDVIATDPDGVYFLGQPIGYDGQTVSSYGGYLYSTGQYDLATLKGYGVLGTLANKVITLPQIPYYDENDQPTGEYYQGVRSTSNGLRYAGWMDDGIEFKITLPDAPKSVKAKAASSARASRFERGMHSFDVVNNKRSTLNPALMSSPKMVKAKKGQYRDRVLNK